MTKPSFSIVIPVYGVEKYIGRCAETLFGQTYDNIQFVFVNDGTKDNSMAVLAEVLERYQHMKDRVVIVNKENGGLPAARKTGMEYVTGDYVLHVDSDDWLELNAVELIAEKAVETSADIIYFDFYKVYSKRIKHDREHDFTAADKAQFIKNLFNYNSYGYVWNKCVKRELYQKHEVFFPKFAMHEDIYLMTQLIWYADSIVHLKAPLYHYRRTNPGSITAGNRRKRRGDSCMNLIDLYEHFKDNVADSPVSPVLTDIFLRSGWFSVVYDFGYFEKYPYLAEMIRKTPIRLGHKPFILFQLFIKLYAMFK